MVRCKFKVSEKILQDDGCATIKMEPVYCGSPENEQFFRYTPFGNFSFGTINPQAAEQMEEGKEYYIDITPAE